METAQLPFNRKCDKNMFRFYRLSLFSLSANNVAFFAEIWLGAVEPFTSSNLTPGVRGALVLDLGEKVLWKWNYTHLLEWRAESGHRARHSGNSGPIRSTKLLALWTCLEKSSITSHLFGLGLPSRCSA